MKNIFLVAIMFIISGCSTDDCPGDTTSTTPCYFVSSPSTSVDYYNNDYCRYLLDISEYTTGCYVRYYQFDRRREAAGYADKMALLRKQEEVPVTCIIEKSE